MPLSAPSDDPIDVARLLLSRAYVPYSGFARAVAVFDATGAWVPGVTVENASFSLSIPALRNALTTAQALGLGPVVAVSTAHPFTAVEVAELHEATGATLAQRSPLLWSAQKAFPTPRKLFSPFIDGAIATPEDGLRQARSVAGRALVPESDFHVGCVAVLPDGRLVPGVNVERAAWSHILCAERNVLGTLVSYGLPAATTLYVVCARGACSPCGACRQVLTELAPEAKIWMTRDSTPLVSTAAALLPDHFEGSTLSR